MPVITKTLMDGAIHSSVASVGSIFAVFYTDPSLQSLVDWS